LGILTKYYLQLIFCEQIKYLIARDGSIIDSFSTVTGPGSNKIIKKIDELLK